MLGASQRQAEFPNERRRFASGGDARQTDAARQAQQPCSGEHGPQGARVSGLALDDLDEDGLWRRGKPRAHDIAMVSRRGFGEATATAVNGCPGDMDREISRILQAVTFRRRG